MGQTRAPVLIETLVTEPAVVRFDVEVLVRRARRDQAHRAAGYMRPGSDNDDFAKSVWGTQYLSIRDTERWTRAGIEPSVGSRDDAYDQRPRRDGDWGVSPARFMNAPGQTVKVRRHSRRSILLTIRRSPCGFMNNAGEDRGDSGDEDPWRSLEAAEFPMLARVYWFNARYFLEPIECVPRAAYDARYSQQVAVA